MTAVGRAIAALVAASTVIGSAAIVLMMLQIVVDVTLRNLFSAPVPGTTTLVAYHWMVIVAYLPLALCERLDGHITVEVLTQLAGPRLRAVLAAVAWAVSAVVAGVVAWTLWGEAVKAFGFGSFVMERSMAVPIWPAYFVLPLGFGLWSLVLTWRLVCAVANRPTGLDLPGEAR